MSLSCVRLCTRPKTRGLPNAGLCPKICDKPNGCIDADKRITNEFREVGEGRGQYEMVPDWNYVGRGNGSFIKAEGESRPRSLQQPDADGGRSVCANRYCLLGMGLLSVAAAIVALVMFFPTPSSVTTTWALQFGPRAGAAGMASQLPAPPVLDAASALSGGPVASRGAAAAAVAAPAALAALYDCGGSLQEGNALAGVWSEEQRTWCCWHQGVGCATTTTVPTTEPYDCGAGLVDWQAGWNDAKKEWCCSHTGMGCPQTTSDAYDCAVPSEAWSFGRHYWCCWHRGTGCNKDTGRQFSAPVWPAAGPVSVGLGGAADRPYDCEAGYSHWERDWSDSKKSWCCENADVGCPVALAV